jgi:hypothetical protein
VLDIECEAIDLGGIASLDNVPRFDGDAQDALFLSASDAGVGPIPRRSRATKFIALVGSPSRSRMKST